MILTELFPEIKDFTKLSENNLNREIIEQRLRILKKSYTLPPQLNAEQNHPTQVLVQKMEIITENEHKHNEISPLALGNIRNGSKTPISVNRNSEKMSDSKQEDYLPQVTVTKV